MLERNRSTSFVLNFLSVCICLFWYLYDITVGVSYLSSLLLSSSLPGPKSDFEFVSNYKLLQVAFKKNHVQRHVEVEKLIRAKYQDNLEFCQWLKAFVERSGADRSDSYDPVAVRAKGKGGKAYNERMSGGAARKAGGSRHVTTASAGRPVTTTKPRVPTRPTPAKTSTTSSRPVTTTITTSARSTNTKEPLKQSSGNKIGVASTSTNKAEADAALMKRNDELEAKNSELESTIRKLEENGIEMEREKDFYFEKLRHVELLLQIKQGSNFEGCDLQNVVDSIFKVLYATAEDNIQIDEEGEVRRMENK